MAVRGQLMQREIEVGYEIDGEVADCWINHAFLRDLVLVDLARVVPVCRCSSTLHRLGQNNIEVFVRCNSGDELAGIGSGMVIAAGAD